MMKVENPTGHNMNVFHPKINISIVYLLIYKIKIQ